MSGSRNQEQQRHRSGGIRRGLGMLAFLPVASRASAYSRLIWELARDARTPVGRKALLVAALGYLVVGRDLIPDDIPVLGGLDDLVVLVLAVDLFFDGVPAEVLDEKLDALGIPRSAFNRDVAQVRRLTHGPVRRIIRRGARAVTVAGRTAGAMHLGPRLRDWINKEGSPA